VNAQVVNTTLPTPPGPVLTTVPPVPGPLTTSKLLPLLPPMVVVGNSTGPANNSTVVVG